MHPSASEAEERLLFTFLLSALCLAGILLRTWMKRKEAIRMHRTTSKDGSTTSLGCRSSSSSSSPLQAAFQGDAHAHVPAPQDECAPLLERRRRASTSDLCLSRERQHSLKANTLANTRGLTVFASTRRWSTASSIPSRLSSSPTLSLRPNLSSRGEVGRPRRTASSDSVAWHVRAPTLLPLEEEGASVSSMARLRPTTLPRRPSTEYAERPRGEWMGSAIRGGSAQSQSSTVSRSASTFSHSASRSVSAAVERGASATQSWPPAVPVKSIRWADDVCGE
ncbi:hypothetical protein T484DRAFT_1850767 [Baffinella frigidus]|nr:hypothetical protein T484DRAFT_1850767 [Cryptophyta sp. CCMP2293]